MWKSPRLKWRAILTTALMIVLVGSLLAACSGGGKNNSNSGNTTQPNSTSPGTSSNTGGETTPAEPAKPKEFRISIDSEPPSLDPSIATDSVSATVSAGLYEGLFGHTLDGTPVPALAESWEVSPDGKTYTFKVRQGAKWSNGDPVTAHDFEYTWKRVLDPETASDYSYMLYYIENGENYNKSKVSADQVGVKALDDYTLEVKLENPTPYFVDIMNHHSYWPVNKNAVEGRPDWATDVKTLVTNGPFLMTEWEHGSKIVLKKNPDYWNADNIHFDTVTMIIVEDDNTALNLFKTGEIDYLGASANGLPIDQIAQLIASGEATVRPSASTYFYQFNTTKKPFNNAKVRKALSMAINRQAIIDNVTKANQTPAFGMVPPSIRGVGGKYYREIYPDNFFEENVEEAKRLLAEGLQEEGFSSFPETTLIYNTNDNHKAIAEAIIDQWRQALGIEVKLNNMEWGTFLEVRGNQEFDIARAGWLADYNHPVTFLYDLLYSTSGNNDGRYSSERYDRLINEALASTDDATIMAKLAEAEKIAFAEDMGVMPIYYYTTTTLEKPGLVNVGPDYASMLDWVHGDWEQ